MPAAATPEPTEAKAALRPRRALIPLLANKAEADRRDRGAEHATRARLQNPRGEDDGKDRRHGERERADPDSGDGRRRHPALRARGVDNRAARNLTDQADDSAGRQDKADIGLGPFFSGQIDGDEGAKSGLHVRQKKDEPVEGAAARERTEQESPSFGDRRAEAPPTVLDGLATRFPSRQSGS